MLAQGPWHSAGPGQRWPGPGGGSIGGRSPPGSRASRPLAGSSAEAPGATYCWSTGSSLGPGQATGLHALIGEHFYRSDQPMLPITGTTGTGPRACWPDPEPRPAQGQRRWADRDEPRSMDNPGPRARIRLGVARCRHRVLSQAAPGGRVPALHTRKRRPFCACLSAKASGLEATCCLKDSEETILSP
jgi:hypothetical protein